MSQLRIKKNGRKVLLAVADPRAEIVPACSFIESQRGVIISIRLPAAVIFWSLLSCLFASVPCKPPQQLKLPGDEKKMIKISNGTKDWAREGKTNKRKLGGVKRG